MMLGRVYDGSDEVKSGWSCLPPQLVDECCRAALDLPEASRHG